MMTTKLKRINEKLDNGIGLLERISKALALLPDLATKGGVALLGAQAVQHPAGALVGLIGLEMAKSGNIVAGSAGVMTLASLGLSQITKASDVEEWRGEVPEQYKEYADLFRIGTQGGI